MVSLKQSNKVFTTYKNGGAAAELCTIA